MPYRLSMSVVTVPNGRTVYDSSQDIDPADLTFRRGQARAMAEYLAALIVDATHNRPDVALRFDVLVRAQ